MTDTGDEAASSSSGVVNRVAWTTVGLVLIRVFYLITSIVTARLLMPEDFAIIGIAATVSTLIDTTSAHGIDHFLIYKQDLKSAEINTAFVLNTILAAVLAIILIALTPVIAQFYHAPQLKTFLIYAALAILMGILGRIPNAILIKDMKQSTMTIINVLTTVLNFVGIIAFALAGFKYLSYVIPLFITNTVKTALYFFFSRRSYGLSFEKETLRSVYRYSRSYMPQALLSYLMAQSDYIMGALFLGATLLGYYYFGFEKAFLVVMIIRTISMQVFFPIFSTHQASPQVIKAQFFEISSYAMFLGYPFLFLLLFCAHEILTLAYSTQWLNSVLTFQLILAYCFLSVLFDLSVVVFNAIGQPSQNLKHYLVAVPLALIGFGVGVKWGGLLGLSIAAFVVHSTSALLMLGRICRYFHWSFAGLLGHFARHLSPIVLLLPVLWPLKQWLMAQQVSPVWILLAMTSLTLLGYWLLVQILLKEVYQAATAYWMTKFAPRFRLGRV